MIKPVLIALKGKGPTTLLKRVWSINRRYGLTSARMDRSLNRLAEILDRFDCRATLPITAVALARSGAVIQKYQVRGIEFAIHGYQHVDYSHLSQTEQQVHLEQAGQIFRNQGIQAKGFRCPYLRWNEATLDALTQAGLAYDSSSSLAWEIAPKHTTDSYIRALDFYGAQSAADYPALPYLDPIHNLVRIPYCLPDDESLVERLNWRSPAEMNQLWPAMFHQIHQQGELFTLGLHPERTEACSTALIATLQQVQAVKAAVWTAPLWEIAAWWQARYAATLKITETDDGLLHLEVKDLPGATLLFRSLDVKTATRPWFEGYQQAVETPAYVVKTTKRPFIGVAPNSSPELVAFLKQQGYVVEVASEPGLYSFYFSHRSFSPREERLLLAQIESSDSPLICLGRWPEGARSALCVTGDIDALTLWDYGLRFMGN